MARDLTLDDVSLALEPELQEEEEMLWWGRIGEARREERGCGAGMKRMVQSRRENPLIVNSKPTGKQYLALNPKP